MLTDTATVRWLGAVAAVALLSLGAVTAAPATVALEGANGRIVWSRDGDVFTMRADGTDKRQVTQNRRYESAQWSPDGRQLAVAQWQATPDQRMRILVMGAHGQNPRVVARLRYTVQSMAWSPDGGRLVLCDLDTSQPDEPAPYPSAIKVVDVAAATVMRLTKFPDRACSPTWSPDGNRIAYSAGDAQDSDIYVMAADGSDTVAVVEDDSTRPLEVAWSPTSDLLAFTSVDASRQGDAWVEVVEVDGTGRRELSRGPKGSADRQPLWAPDGNRLLFFRNRFDAGTVSLRVVDLSGAHQMVIRNAEVGHAAWSPDSAQVVFGRRGDILTRPLDGTADVVAGVRTAFDGSPDWQAR